MPAGRLRHKRIRGHQRYYRKYKDGGDDRYSYLNKEAYARMLPVMERKKRLEAYLRQWRKWRPKLEGIFSQVDKLLADGGLFAAFAELVAAAPLSPELLAAAREDFRQSRGLYSLQSNEIVRGVQFTGGYPCRSTPTDW